MSQLEASTSLTTVGFYISFGFVRARKKVKSISTSIVAFPSRTCDIWLGVWLLSEANSGSIFTPQLGRITSFRSGGCEQFSRVFKVPLALLSLRDQNQELLGYWFRYTVFRLLVGKGAAGV